jgi:hypothetical protein
VTAGVNIRREDDRLHFTRKRHRQAYCALGDNLTLYTSPSRLNLELLLIATEGFPHAPSPDSISQHPDSAAHRSQYLHFRAYALFYSLSVHQMAGGYMVHRHTGMDKYYLLTFILPTALTLGDDCGKLSHILDIRP